jgi:hypothetical protein
MRIAEKQVECVARPAATEVRFSIRTLLIVMAIFAVAISALAAFIRTFPADLRMELALYWGVLAALVLALLIFHAWRRRKAELNAGRILWELDRHSFFLPNAPRLATTLVGILSLLAAPAMWVVGSHDIASGRPLSAWLWQFNYATISCIVASGSAVTYFWWRRIRLAENGIIARSQYFPWAVCNHWRWDARSKNVAVVSTTTRGKIAFEVTEQERSAVEALLERQVYVRFKEKL